MKHVEATLRAGISELEAKEIARRQALPPSLGRVLIPDFRVLASHVEDVQDAAA
jgi:hypothetical protein